MKAVNELRCRLKRELSLAQIDSEIADISTKHTATCHQIAANSWFSAFVYAKSLNDDNALLYSQRADEYYQKAYDVHPPGQLYNLTQLYINAVLRGDDTRLDLAKHISIMAYDKTQDELHSVLTLVGALLSVNQSVENFLPQLANEEKHKSDIVPFGSTDAVKAILSNDEPALINSVDELLAIHAKRAGNLRSSISIGSSNTVICRMAILLCEAAQQRGMDIKEKLNKRRQKMNLRLCSPAEFPDIKETIKFPLEVDFLTGQAFLK
ncbi:hypothetical protein [Alteromonas sp. RKMC-009]|uniref:hypothetical protein n=1 Tax=Alteromonas sp. RKMC-009 TaxID=2267264 RepID=UPI000E69A786|nr:hypothetical protein [Alteromonas sp. RKMC-009]AYA65474.1 hypothetical protein DS731_16380 [Alteromonas sp. RKMC-009]